MKIIINAVGGLLNKSKNRRDVGKSNDISIYISVRLTTVKPPELFKY